MFPLRKDNCYNLFPFLLVLCFQIPQPPFEPSHTSSLTQSPSLYFSLWNFLEKFTSKKWTKIPKAATQQRTQREKARFIVFLHFIVSVSLHVFRAKHVLLFCGTNVFVFVETFHEKSSRLNCGCGKMKNILY